MKRFKKLWFLLLLPVVVGLLVNWLTPIDIPGAIWSAVKWFFGLFLVTSMLPVWGIILLMLTIPLVLGVGLLFLGRAETHLTYTSDTFFGISWHWSYVGGQLYDQDITPRCPHCKTVLEPVHESAYAVVDDITLACHHCGFKKRFEFNLVTLLDRVKLEVDRKIESLATAATNHLGTGGMAGHHCR